jgi:acetoin utilization deacetylase AcuC-like enzyme
MSTAILTDPRYLAHDDPQHVERADRLRSILRALDTSGLRETLPTLDARPATNDEILMAHTEAHIAAVQRFGDHGGGYLDPDTYMNESSWEAALWAAGGTMRTVEAVLTGEHRNAYALVRPPGHHATRSRAMGFCLINNVAVAARYAIKAHGLERVAIVDYDVHHGNGTQDIFYNDPNVLYCSTHASPYYPGTGLLHETGEAPGQGATLNVPLPLGVGDTGYQQVFEKIIIPALRKWQPQLVLLSAGYDCHWSDPIGPMVLSILGYARLTQMLYELAEEVCEGRMVITLEGGYNLDALGAGVVAALQVLQGQPPDHDPLGTINAPEPELAALIERITKSHPMFTS